MPCSMLISCIVCCVGGREETSSIDKLENDSVNREKKQDREMIGKMLQCMTATKWIESEKWIECAIWNHCVWHWAKTIFKFLITSCKTFYWPLSFCICRYILCHFFFFCFLLFIAAISTHFTLSATINFWCFTDRNNRYGSFFFLSLFFIQIHLQLWLTIFFPRFISR